MAMPTRQQDPALSNQHYRHTDDRKAEQFRRLVALTDVRLGWRVERSFQGIEAAPAMPKERRYD